MIGSSNSMAAAMITRPKQIFPQLATVALLFFSPLGHVARAVRLILRLIARARLSSTPLNGLTKGGTVVGLQELGNWSPLNAAGTQFIPSVYTHSYPASYNPSVRWPLAGCSVCKLKCMQPIGGVRPSEYKYNTALSIENWAFDANYLTFPNCLSL